MERTTHNLPDYFVPLRKPVPTLHYDLSLWCQELLKIHPFPFPSSLQDLQHQVEDYAAQCPVYPAENEFRFRIYVVDHRLFIPMILTDNKGNLSNACYRFVRYKHRYEDNVLGEGKAFSDLHSESGWDDDFVKQFIREFDISPVEVLSVPTLLVFAGDKLDDYRPMGTWQLCTLLHRYMRSNCVDWSHHIDWYNHDVGSLRRAPR